MDICGQCTKEFPSEQAYLNHSCITGYKPTEIEHLGENFVLQSKEALKRTGSLTKTREKELDQTREKVKEEGIDHKLMLAKENRLDEIGV